MCILHVSELSTEIEIGLNASDVIDVNETTEGQELDYEDTVQEEYIDGTYVEQNEGGYSAQVVGMDGYSGHGEGEYSEQSEVTGTEDMLVVDNEPNVSSAMFSSSQVMKQLIIL